MGFFSKDENHHNDGQKDASNGVNNPPHNDADKLGGIFMDILMPFGGSLSDKMDKDNANYDKGQKNGSK